jgi:uncharacterized protein YkwD
MKLKHKRFVPAIALIGAIALSGCSTPESSFPSKTNDARRAVGKGALSTEPPGGTNIYNRARLWANKMCNDRAISHTTAGGGTLSGYYQPAAGWRGLGENVGRTGWNANNQNSWTASTDGLFSAFMNSTLHRNNILGNYTHQVVAQHVCNDGMIYVTHVFLLY